MFVKYLYSGRILFEVLYFLIPPLLHKRKRLDTRLCIVWTMKTSMYINETKSNFRVILNLREPISAKVPFISTLLQMYYTPFIHYTSFLTHRFGRDCLMLKVQSQSVIEQMSRSLKTTSQKKWTTSTILFAVVLVVWSLILYSVVDLKPEYSFWHPVVWINVIICTNTACQMCYTWVS
mgnify:CR=1 FL=1